MRGLRFVVVCLLAALAASAAHAAPVFVLTGKGWGHGLGLSQYGAQGSALTGSTYEEILEHYYTGAAVTGGQPNNTVRVLLASGRASLTLESASTFEAGGVPLAAGTYTVTAGAGEVRLRRSGTTTAVASPATVAPGTASLELGGVLYRGSLVLAASPAGTTVSALNVLLRQGYLQGVVPREMPASWHAQALAAQAIAARTYSLTGGHCQWLGDPVFCPDTRDQVYGGRSAETAATNAAVQGTAGEIVTHGGSPVAAYFFSTSGGRTAAKADEWGPPAVPYLVSVLDEHDDISPHHAWGPKDAEIDCAGTSPDCVFTAAKVQTLLGLAERPVDLEVTARNSSTRVATLQATGKTTGASFTGTEARTELGLRSTWFYVGVLSLQPSVTTVTYGGSVRLSGLARRGGTVGWGTAALQRRRAGETSWETVGAPLPNGAWERIVRPKGANDYRVVSGNATGEAQRILVRTKVAFLAPKPPFARLRGSVRPAGSGIFVTLARRRADGSFVRVGTTRTAADGSFSFAVGRLGTYRARADAGANLLVGSALVTIPPA
jgi:stage II sporulation protein D